MVFSSKIMWLYLVSGFLLTFDNLVFGQYNQKPESCQSSKDCPSDLFCAEFKCINPCLLNLCNDPSQCMVSNHIPVCACNGTFSGPLHGRLSTKGDKKFRLNLEKMTWMQALVYCNSQDMRLATIESQDEQERLANQIKQSAAYKTESNHRKKWWIGGSDLHRRGDYLWTSTGRRFTYKNFPNGQPENLSFNTGEVEQCMEMIADWNYQWNDGLCSQNQYFVCEYFE